MSVAEAIAAVRARIAASARAAGRTPEEITLIAVTKTQPIEAVLRAHDCGMTDFGENTVQGLCKKAAAMAEEGRRVRWHLIGHLQRNKINKLLPFVQLIHTVDRAELAQALQTRAPPGGLDVLVQVNIGREPQKGGVDPDAAVVLARDVAMRPGLRLRGLMAVPPADVDPQPYFAALARLSRQLRATPEGEAAHELSMGMSHDFEIGIASGATMVRVGTAIFGVRRILERDA